MDAENIVKRLIDEHLISGEEAVTLINAINKPKEVITYPITFPYTTPNHNWWDDLPQYVTTHTLDPNTVKFTTTSGQQTLS